MENNFGSVTDATGYGWDFDPRGGTAPIPINYKERLQEALQEKINIQEKNAVKAALAGLPFKYPNGGALTRDHQAPRRFATGATRSSDEGKPDYEGFISPLVLHRFGQYMTKHRKMEDGGLRESDNWQKGIPRKQYLKSMLRHVMDVWLIMRYFSGQAEERDLTEALCAVKFNVDGMLHEVLQEQLGHPSATSATTFADANQMLQAGAGGLGAGW